MASGISYGLHALKVSGREIVDSVTSVPVLLRGIVRSGLEYSAPDSCGALANAGITADEIEEIVSGWGANIVRLPFNQEWAVTRFGYDPEPYLQALDFVIGEAASRGAYTLLDLQWLDARTPRGHNSDSTTNFVAPLPNLLSVAVWRQLAKRYADENAVLYDIFNEPHDQLPGDPVPLLGLRKDLTTFPLATRRVSMKEWRPWASCLINTIREENPNALIFVSGVDWGYDLRGFPPEELEGVVYATHIYRNKGTNWDRAFGFLGKDFPLFASEWGGEFDDLAWGATLLEYMNRKNMGWTAWSWSDKPRLTRSNGSVDYLPSVFGELVRRSLRVNGRTRLQPVESLSST